MSDVAHYALKRAEAVAKLTGTAAARDGEVELNAPVTFIIGSLDGWDTWRIGHTLEYFGGCAIVLLAQGKDGICRFDGTRLVGILPVEAEIESFGEESHTCRVAIDTIETDGSVTSRVTEKVDTLICVG